MHRKRLWEHKGVDSGVFLWSIFLQKRVMKVRLFKFIVVQVWKTNARKCLNYVPFVRVFAVARFVQGAQRPSLICVRCVCVTRSAHSESKNTRKWIRKHFKTKFIFVLLTKESGHSTQRTGKSCLHQRTIKTHKFSQAFQQSPLHVRKTNTCVPRKSIPSERHFTKSQIFVRGILRDPEDCNLDKPGNSAHLVLNNIAECTLYETSQKFKHFEHWSLPQILVSRVREGCSGLFWPPWRMRLWTSPPLYGALVGCADLFPK